MLMKASNLEKQVQRREQKQIIIKNRTHIESMCFVCPLPLALKLIQEKNMPQ